MNQVMAEMLGAFVSTQQLQLEELERDPQTTPEQAAMALRARSCERHFTRAVDLLRGSSPSPVLRDLGQYGWQVFHHQHVRLAVGPNVPSLHVAAWLHDGRATMAVFPPLDWPKMVMEDASLQFGAVVFCVSQAVDFYNQRIAETKQVMARARSYEAEFLKHLSAETLTPYQREVLEEFPNGWDGSLQYERLPVFPLEGPGTAS